MTHELDRRGVLKAGAIASGIVVGGIAVSACSSAEEVGSAVASEGATNSVPIADIPVGGGVIPSDATVVITQPVSGEFHAFTAVCPHGGCLVNEVTNNEIICPCHGSRFSATDGSVLAGPAVEGLSEASFQVNGSDVSFG